MSRAMSKVFVSMPAVVAITLMATLWVMQERDAMAMSERRRMQDEEVARFMCATCG